MNKTPMLLWCWHTDIRQWSWASARRGGRAFASPPGNWD